MTLTPFSLIRTLCVVPIFLGYGAITTITLNNFIGIFIFIISRTSFLFLTYILSLKEQYPPGCYILDCSLIRSVLLIKYVFHVSDYDVVLSRASGITTSLRAPSSPVFLSVLVSFFHAATVAPVSVRLSLP